jgi:hypothetical protein
MCASRFTAAYAGRPKQCCLAADGFTFEGMMLREHAHFHFHTLYYEPSQHNEALKHPLS